MIGFLAKTPKVSIIVPVYNGEKTLSLCLDSLINLDFPKEDLEIIVVDNNSIDATKEIIARYPVRHIFESKRGRGAARNKGMREARGELAAFIDADCVADRLWLKNIIKGFNNDSIGGCGGEILSYKPQTLIEKYVDSKLKMTGFQKKGLVNLEVLLPRIVTCNAVYQRKIIEEIGLFDDKFTTLEDMDLSWRIYLSGYELIYEPSAIVYHKHRNNYIDFVKHRFELGENGTYLLYKYINIIKRPLFSCNDLVRFFFKQFKSTGNPFITLLIGKNYISKVSPIFDIIQEISFFLGRLYGLFKVRRGIIKFSILPNSHQLLYRIVDKKVVISEPNRNFYYTLDELGSEVWVLLKEGKNISEIVYTIADEYEVDKEDVKNDIVAFIDELRKEGLV